jgi:hypothetical protein
VTIREQLRRRTRSRRVACYGGFVAAIAPFLSGGNARYPVSVVLISAVIWVTVVSLVTWGAICVVRTRIRCPRCAARLADVNADEATGCPECGVSFDAPLRADDR